HAVIALDPVKAAFGSAGMGFELPGHDVVLVFGWCFNAKSVARRAAKAEEKSAKVKIVKYLHFHFTNLR
ncbi:MAG: hypothetical protein VXY93_02945, partial [Pseudomonadota bacterium]|nr:hypothetical protein [Pseudomonadota bacterium]